MMTLLGEAAGEMAVMLTSRETHATAGGTTGGAIDAAAAESGTAGTEITAGMATGGIGQGMQGGTGEPLWLTFDPLQTVSRSG